MTVYRTIYSSYVLPIMASTLTVLIDKLGPGRNPNDFSIGNQAPYSSDSLSPRKYRKRLMQSSQDHLSNGVSFLFFLVILII